MLIDANSCYSDILFPAQGMQYSQVCGKIIGYEYGEPAEFGYGNLQIIDGMNLTYESPQQHEWSFAAALDEHTGLRIAGDKNYDHCLCDCTDATDSTYLHTITFVMMIHCGIDGEGCGPKSTC